MIITYADDTHHKQLAEFFINKNVTLNQAYAWLRTHKYIVKGLKYKAVKVLGFMQIHKERP